MKALTISPGTEDVVIRHFPEPKIETLTQVKMKILEVGICGTDREQVISGHVNPPPGSDHLVIGHEMLGKVIGTGPEVSTVSVGDYGVLSVRRGCGKCIPCEYNRSDMCYTTGYVERGIKGLHGFETEFVVDDEQYLVKVPEIMRPIGVLTEPMSVAQKAIDEALIIQSARLPELPKDRWLSGRKTLVAGLDAIGLLAAIALRLRGAEVIGLDIVGEHTRRPSFLKKIGGRYINGSRVDTLDLDDTIGEVDFIFEAAGVAELGFNLIDALGINGIYVMTGLPSESRIIDLHAGSLMKQMVLKNHVVVGSVNASPKHFGLAITDLEKATNKWGKLMEELITTRIKYTDFRQALEFRSVDDIKTVIEWGR